MFIITAERDGYFEHTRYFFYSLNEVKKIATDLFKSGGVDFVSVQNSVGKTFLSLLRD